jgi:hypothetical protein
MPDTGLPWEIPYAAPADLVRDWPALSEDVADAVAAGLSAAGPAGIGSNVVSVTKTDVFTTANTSPTDVTGLSVTITPSTATSKILVMAYVPFSHSSTGGSQSGFIRLIRDSTPLMVGDTAGSRTLASAAQFGTTVNWGGYYPGITILDDPQTSSAVTYKVQAWKNNAAGTANVNRWPVDTDTAHVPRFASSLTVIEVAV